jgi:membrane fusion protein, multidrug efflux system
MLTSIYRNNLFVFIVLSAMSAAFLTFAGCTKTEADSLVVRPALVFKINPGAGLEADVYAGEVRSRVEADMAFRIGGKMVARLVDQGATVRKGQALARLDPQDVKLASDAARAQVAASEAEFNFAQAELQRFKSLLQKGFISQSAFDAKQNAFDAAKARFESTQAQAAVNLNQTAYTTLLAEQDGVVTNVMAETGQVVSQGQAVMRIANPAEREVAISVSESKIGEFRSAKDARQLLITLSSQPDKTYPAKVREIGAAADPATRTYPVRVSIVNADDNVKIGMTANVAFVSATASDQVAVPLSALYQQGDKTSVWHVGADNKLARMPVTVVKYRENAALIKGSLKAGDLIVAAGVHKLREGQTVKPITDPFITGDGKVAVVPSEAGAQFAVR